MGASGLPLNPLTIHASVSFSFHLCSFLGLSGSSASPASESVLAEPALSAIHIRRYSATLIKWLRCCEQYRSTTKGQDVSSPVNRKVFSGSFCHRVAACTSAARVYSRDGPIRRRNRGYILVTDQSDALPAPARRRRAPAPGTAGPTPTAPPPGSPPPRSTSGGRRCGRRRAGGRGGGGAAGAAGARRPCARRSRRLGGGSGGPRASARAGSWCAPPPGGSPCGQEGVRRGSGGDLSIKSRRP
eukprot:1193843-Prorocentrum_minimum.AAC.2